MLSVVGFSINRDFWVDDFVEMLHIVAFNINNIVILFIKRSLFVIMLGLFLK